MSCYAAREMSNSCLTARQIGDPNKSRSDFRLIGHGASGATKMSCAGNKVLNALVIRHCLSTLREPEMLSGQSPIRSPDGLRWIERQRICSRTFDYVQEHTLARGIVAPCGVFDAVSCRAPVPHQA